jgi:hypothetical protein
MATDAHRHTGNDQERNRHVHSLARLDANGLPSHGYRYECRACGARLKKRSGVMIAELKALNPVESCPAENQRFQSQDRE